MTISLKKIKEALEKLKTLDEKRAYLENLLKEAKSEKLKWDIKKLLDIVLKHLKHEEKLSSKEKLEAKLTTAGVTAEEATTEIPVSEVSFSAIKYQRQRRAGESELEATARAAPAADIGAELYKPAPGPYAAQTVNYLRNVLEEAGLADQFSYETWRNMPENQRSGVFSTVSKTLGIDSKTQEDYTKVMAYVRSVFEKQEDEEKKKYKTKFTG
jgi:hypothetical protein